MLNKVVKIIAVQYIPFVYVFPRIIWRRFFFHAAKIYSNITFT